MATPPQTGALAPSERPFAAAHTPFPALAGEVHCDLTGHLIYVNDRLCEMLGYSRAELLQMRVADITYHEDLPHSLEHFRHMVQTGTPFELSKRYVCKDSRVIWCSLTAQLVYAADGQAQHTRAFLLDVTAQQEAEAKLRASKSQFRDLAAAAPVGIFCTDAAGHCTYVNEYWSQISGMSTPEALGTGWVKALHPEDRDQVFALWMEAAQNKQPFSAEYRLVNEKQEVSWVFGQAKAQTDAEGKIIGYVGTLTNLTDRKIAEEALHESERLQSFLIHLTDALASLADPLQIQMAAASAVGEYLGVERALYAELSGDEILIRGDYTNGVPSLAGRHSLRAFGNSIAEAVARGETVVIDDVEQHPLFDDATKAAYAVGQVAALIGVGFLKHADWLGAFAVHSAQPRQWETGEVQIVREVAERTWAAVERARAKASLRESEERLRRVSDNAEVGLTRLSRDWIYLSANPAYAAIAGKPLEQIIGRPMVEVLGTSGVEAIQPQVERVLRGEHVTYEAQVPFVGTGQRYLHVSYSPDTDAVGEIVGWVACVTDITERKQMEAALQRAHDDLLLQVNERRAAEAQVQELLRRVVSAQEAERQRISRELHDEMGQHLSALAIAVKALQECPECPSQAAIHLAHIKASLAAMEEEVDRLAFELHPPALNSLGVAEALQQYAEDWTTISHIPVDFQPLGLAHERLNLEAETALYRIAQEALTNILKHAQATQVGIIVEWRRAEVRLIIEDNGSGFDPEAMRQAYQTGLRSMQERLALLHGTLTVETAPGQGTTIYACLPVHPRNLA